MADEHDRAGQLVARDRRFDQRRDRREPSARLERPAMGLRASSGAAVILAARASAARGCFTEFNIY